MASIFPRESVFTRYACEIQLRGKLLGGIPKDPAIIENWLRARAGIDQEEEVRQAMLRTLVELGAEVSEHMSYDQLVEASKSLAAVKQTNGFKRNADGLYLEDRQLKAAIKEAVNILFAGTRWGPTKKGPRNYTAERVFVNPSEIKLGVKEPDGIELLIVHATTPQGPRSSLSYHEFVEQPKLVFEVMVAQDGIEHDHWPQIWVVAEEGGIGACRSQSYGRFDVVKWEKV